MSIRYPLQGISLRGKMSLEDNERNIWYFVFMFIMFVGIASIIDFIFFGVSSNQILIYKIPLLATIIAIFIAQIIKIYGNEKSQIYLTHE